MPALEIEHDDVVLVADGRKALFLRNHGDADLVDLRVESVMTAPPNPKTAAQGTDRPGRAQDSMTGRPSAYEQTDWHELAEREFAAEVAAAIGEHERKGRIAALIVAAPPAALAELRAALPDAVRRKIKAEVAKDLTMRPIPEIEKLLVR